jgi:hypothetical protein
MKGASRVKIPWVPAAVLAAAAAFAFGSPADAQTRAPTADGCTVNAEGILECGTIEIHGTLRNIVMVTFSREGLGIRLLELRQSFLQDIVDSVGEAPF